MAIASTNFKILSDLQRIDLLNRLIAILIPLADNDTEIAELTPVLQASVEKLKLAMARSSENKLSTRITAADDIRDDALIMISGTCRLYSKKAKVEKREAAELIGSIYNDIFDGISLNNNGEETPAVDLFLEKIATTAAGEAIVTLDLVSEVDAIKTSQPEYIELVAQREKLRASDETPLLVPTRREMRAELNHLVSHMKFKFRRESEKHISAINEMNETIKAISSVAKAEQTRKENDSEE